MPNPMKNTKAKFNHVSISDSNHESAELIGSNDDLVNEILGRLPSKSILRFKAVSKKWLSLLTHPRFTALYDKLLKSSGLYYHEFHLSYDVENPTTPPFNKQDFYPDLSSLASFPEYDDITIVQSCNGLLLCRYDICPTRYYVFNPTIKKFAVIPDVIGTERRIRLMGLVYHPTECVHYKLVCILRVGRYRLTGYNEENGHRMYYIQIYSSETGKWKKLSQTFTPLCFPCFGYGVYWNGAFYWAPCCPNPMYFRLDKEELQDLPLPSPLPVRVTEYGYGDYVMTPLYFGESCGHLHLVDTADINNRLNVNVYEMLRDHSGWFIKYQLNLHELSVAYPNMTHKDWPYHKYEFRVLDFVRGEEEEDTFMVVKAVDDIKKYNILDKSFQQLFSVPNMDEEYNKHSAKAFAIKFRYINSYSLYRENRSFLKFIICY